MTNLTEYSWYYCKMNDGDIRMLERGADYFLDGDVPLLENEVWKVLGEVPTYDEYITMKRLIADSITYGDRLKAMQEENAQLKELLKECGDWLAYIDRDDGLIAKIDEVLGDK